MSSGSKPGFGPSLPRNLNGYRPSMGGGKRTHRKRAKSPRVLGSLPPLPATHGRGAPNDIVPMGNPVAGITATDTQRVRRPKLNTNANRKHGGGSTNYRPKAEDLVGRDIINDGANVTAPNVTRTGNRKIGQSVKAAKEISVDESLRLNVAARTLYAADNGVPLPPWARNVAWPDRYDFKGQ